MRQKFTTSPRKNTHWEEQTNLKFVWDRISHTSTQMPLDQQTHVVSRTPAQVRQISKSNYSLEKISS